MNDVLSRSTTKSVLFEARRSSAQRRRAAVVSPQNSPSTVRTVTLWNSSDLSGMVGYAAFTASSGVGTARGARAWYSFSSFRNSSGEMRKKRLGQLRIELRARAPPHFNHRHFQRQRPAIRAVAGHRVEAVGDADDPAHQRNVLAAEAHRVAPCRRSARGGAARRESGPESA